MKRFVSIVGLLAVLVVGYAAAHLALIEAGREVVVLRTRDAQGSSHETRLWVVDDAGRAWVLGDPDSSWMRRLREHPAVELERAGHARAYRAEPVPGARERILALMREKYGHADRWVRFITDPGNALPVRFDPPR